MDSSILRSGLAISGALLIGRLLGFVREATIAGTLGVDRTADVAIFLIGLPDFLVNVLGAGGFTAILVVAYRRRPEEAARLLLQSSLSIFAAVGALACVLILFRSFLIDTLAPGFDAVSRQHAMDLLPFALLSAPIAAMTGAAVGFLQAQSRFFMASIGGAVINSVLIAALLVAPSDRQLSYLAAGIIVGAGCRWLMLATSIGSRGMSTPFFRPWRVDMNLARAFALAATTEGIVFLYPFALRAIATLFGIGALASVNYATKLVQLPLGLAVMTLTTVLLPRLASLAPEKGETVPSGFLELARHGLYWILGLGVTAVAILTVHSGWLVDLAFGWGEINASELANIAFYAAVFSLNLIPMALNMFLRRTLNALGETGIPLRAEVSGFLTFMAMAFLVIEGGGALEHVLLSVPCGTLVSSTILMRGCHRLGAPLSVTLLQPALGGALILAAMAAAAPGLALHATGSDSPWLPAGAIALGGLAALSALIVCHPPARQAAVRFLGRSSGRGSA